MTLNCFRSVQSCTDHQSKRNLDNFHKSDAETENCFCTFYIHQILCRIRFEASMKYKKDIKTFELARKEKRWRKAIDEENHSLIQPMTLTYVKRALGNRVLLAIQTLESTTPSIFRLELFQEYMLIKYHREVIFMISIDRSYMNPFQEIKLKDYSIPGHLLEIYLWRTLLIPLVTFIGM